MDIFLKASFSKGCRHRPPLSQPSESGSRLGRRRHTLSYPIPALLPELAMGTKECGRKLSLHVLGSVGGAHVSRRSRERVRNSSCDVTTRLRVAAFCGCVSFLSCGHRRPSCSCTFGLPLVCPLWGCTTTKRNWAGFFCDPTRRRLSRDFRFVITRRLLQKLLQLHCGHVPVLGVNAIPPGRCQRQKGPGARHANDRPRVGPSAVN